MKTNGINIGSASLILIFMVMSLSCVSLLTLSVVNKDLKATYRIEKKVQNYYNADTEANRYLEKVYMTLEEALKLDNIQDYLCQEFGDEWNNEDHTLSNQISISEYQDLSIKLKLYWEEDRKGVEVLEWCVVNKDISPNQDMNVFIFE